MPQRFPVAALKRSDRAVRLRSLNVADEDVTVPLVSKGVEQQLEVVLVLLPEILPDVVDHQARGLAVVEVGCDVEGAFVKGHPDLGRFRGRLSLLGSLWMKPETARALPDRLVEHAIHSHRSIPGGSFHGPRDNDLGADGIPWYWVGV